MNISTERQRWCPGHQKLLPLSYFDADRKSKSGYSALCHNCATGGTLPETDATRIECSTCHRQLLLSVFGQMTASQRETPAGKARYGRRYSCNSCEAELTRKRAAARRGKLPLLDSGQRIHVGVGIVSQEKPAPPITVPELIQPVSPPVVQSVYADMTVVEWLAMDQVPSVFVFDKYALVLSREDAEYRIRILTITGDGPGQSVEPGLASYIVKILTRDEPDTIRGAMFY